MSTTSVQGSLADVKRLIDRIGADPEFHQRLLSDPSEATRAYGFDKDFGRELWDPSWREKSEVGEAYRELIRGKLALREKMRSSAPAHHPGYQQWRQRQIARVHLELGQGRAETIIHAPMCFELNKGCSVGCWFCGISAPKLSDIWEYTPENAALWKETLAILKDVVGPLSRYGFCYWATDPLDNPDYEQFCCDYHDILGVFPQTTTALGLKYPDRVRSLLKTSTERGCDLNRFSLLSLKMFLKAQEIYTAEELLHVECIPQNKESSLTMARAGKAAERHEKGGVSDYAGTIACVSGFLFNMVDRSWKLITPCASSEAWPLGYWVVAQSTFADGPELKTQVTGVLDSLATDVHQLPRLRFARYLEYRETAEGIELASPCATLLVRHPRPEFIQGLGRLVRDGVHDAGELEMLARFSLGVSADEVKEQLQLLFDQGALDEDPAA